MYTLNGNRNFMDARLVLKLMTEIQLNLEQEQNYVTVNTTRRQYKMHDVHNHSV